MANIGLFFGSDEGNTESVAEKIQACLGPENIDIFDIADVTQLEFDQYDRIILGIPTWDFGQIQSDWEEFWPDLENLDFSGKTVAMFGLGDQFGYGDFFLDAMGELYQVVLKTAASVVGFWPVDGYEFDASKALLADQNCFVGLAIDEDQQEELTNTRINQWCQQVCAEFDLDIDITLLED
ncbi:flavodoxin FldB [Halioxenophilus aromaticivorans]|uniref:Flavodoxin n=1 Tax=Halioxenophilus aromaticivorans TaxID=1306992 RepID=A0AAV3TWG2_9ALTE